MKRMRILALLLCLCICLGVFAGCQKSDSADSKKEEQAEQAPAEEKTEAPAEEKEEPAEEAAEEKEPAEDVLYIKIGHVNGGDPDDHYGYWCLKANEYLQEICDGKIQFDIYSDSLYGTEAEAWAGLHDGTIDAFVESLNAFSSASPEFNAFEIWEMPFLFQSEAEYLALWDDEEFSAPLIEALEAYGAHPMCGILDASFRGIMLNGVEANKMSDLANVTVRVTTSAIHEETLKAIGCIPTVIAWGETYTALQQGACDGVDAQIPIAYVMGFYETATSYVSLNKYPILGIPLINTTLWNSLTEEQQGWITEAAQKAMIDQREHQLQRVKDLTKFYEDECGMTITYPDPTEFKEAVQPIYEKYRPEIGEDTFAAAEAFLEEYRAAH